MSLPFSSPGISQTPGKAAPALPFGPPAAPTNRRNPFSATRLSEAGISQFDDIAKQEREGEDAFYRTQARQQSAAAQQQKLIQDANAEQEKQRQKALELDVTRASLQLAKAPETMTRTQREALEKKQLEEEAKVNRSAAATVAAATRESPAFNERTDKSWLPFGMGEEPTPAAKELQDRAAAMDAPGYTPSASDLDQYRKINPTAFSELDSFKSTLESDKVASEQRTAAELAVARAKAIKDGLSPEEVDSLLGKPVASSAVEADTLDIDTRKASMARIESEVNSLATRESELTAEMQKGATSTRFDEIKQELATVSQQRTAKAAELTSQQKQVQDSAAALETKKKAQVEQSLSGQNPAILDTALKTAKVLADGSFETSQPEKIEALAKAGKKVFYSDGKQDAKPPTDAIRKEKKALTESKIKDISETAATLRAGSLKISENIQSRVDRGDITKEQGNAEWDSEIDAYSKQNEAKTAELGQYLGDAIDDFKAGTIDAATLNAIYHAAGQPETGVEAFKEHKAKLDAEDAHVEALSKVMLGADGSGKDDPTFNGQAMALTAQIEALSEKVRAYEGYDETENIAGVSAGEMSAQEADVERANNELPALQKKLADMRSEQRSKLRTELTRRGVPEDEHAGLIARAELSTPAPRVDAATAIEARGGGVKGAAGAVIEKIPYFGGFAEIARLAPYATLAAKLEKGETLSGEELDSLTEFVRYSGREGTTAMKIVEGVATFLSFGVEMAGATTGVGAGVTATRKAAAEAVKGAITWAGTKKAYTMLAKAKAETLLKGSVTGGTVAKAIVAKTLKAIPQTAKFVGGTGANKTLAAYVDDKATQGIGVTEQEGKIVAALDRTGSLTGEARHSQGRMMVDALFGQAKEFTTEKVGAAMPLLGKVLGRSAPKAAAAWQGLTSYTKNNVAAAAMARLLKKINPLKQNGDIARFMRAAGQQGLGMEILEERIGDVADAAYTFMQDGKWDLKLPNAENFAVEVATMLIPMGAGAVQSVRAQNRIDKAITDSDAESSARIANLFAKPDDTAQMLSAESGQRFTADDVTELRNLAGPIEKSDAVRKSDERHIALLVKASQAEEAGDPQKAYTLKQMALEESRNKGDLAIDHLRKAANINTQIKDALRQADEIEAAPVVDAKGKKEAQAQALEVREAVDLARAVVKISRGLEAELTKAETTILKKEKAYDKGVISQTAIDKAAKLVPGVKSFVRPEQEFIQKQISASVGLVSPAQAGNVSPQVGGSSAAAASPSPSAAPAATQAPAPVQAPATAPANAPTNAPAGKVWRVMGSDTFVDIPHDMAKNADEAQKIAIGRRTDPQYRLPEDERPTEVQEIDTTTATAPANTPISKQPSKTLSTQSVAPRPLRVGRDTTERDAWDEAYGEMRKGGKTHNEDGSPYQPTVFDEVATQIMSARQGMTDEEAIAAIGDQHEVSIASSVTTLIDAGWTWNTQKRKMVPPLGSDPNETPFNAIIRLQRGTKTPAPAPATSPPQTGTSVPQNGQKQPSGTSSTQPTGGAIDRKTFIAEKLNEALKNVGAAFTGITFNKSVERGEVEPESESVNFDLDAIDLQTREITDPAALQLEIEKVVEEEVHHVETVKLLKRRAKKLGKKHDDLAAESWNDVTPELRKRVELLYNYGKSFPAGMPDSSKGYELYRFYTQMAKSGQITEGANFPESIKGLSKKAYNELVGFLRDLGTWMIEQLPKMPPAKRKQFKKDVAAVVKAVKALENYAKKSKPAKGATNGGLVSGSGASAGATDAGASPPSSAAPADKAQTTIKASSQTDAERLLGPVSDVARSLMVDGWEFAQNDTRDGSFYLKKGGKFKHYNADGSPFDEAADVAPEKPASAPKSSTQFTLSPTDAAPILAFGESIPKAELFESVDPEWSNGALEDEPHVTVLYGLTKHEAAPVQKSIADHGPVTVTLGKMSLFESAQYDVLKIDVESKSLRELNAKLAKLPNENSFPDYKPHMTIAYLKKGEGKKYVGDARFDGREITFGTMTFSPPKELRGEIGKPELSLQKLPSSVLLKPTMMEVNVTNGVYEKDGATLRGYTVKYPNGLTKNVRLSQTAPVIGESPQTVKPEQSKTTQQEKEPWQMTLAEYRKHTQEVDAEIRSREPLHESYTQEEADDLYRRELSDAIKKGKPVPAEVLADYPDLNPTPEATAPAKPSREFINLTPEEQLAATSPGAQTIYDDRGRVSEIIPATAEQTPEEKAKIAKREALKKGFAGLFSSERPSPGGLTEADAKTPMTIYRAGDSDEVGVKPFSSWSPDEDTAIEYQDNPGFGGDTLRQLRVDAGNVLEIDTTTRRGMGDLAEALGFDRDVGEEWFSNGWRYPWEESGKVKRALEESEFDAVQYVDDFPEGATTIIFTREPKSLTDPRAQNGTALFSARRPAPEPSTEQVDIPKDKERRMAIMEAAGVLVDNDVDTPEQLIRDLDDISPALRKYADAFWRVMTGFDESLEESPDWNAVFAGIDQAEAQEPVSPDAKISQEAKSDEVSSRPPRVEGVSGAVSTSEAAPASNSVPVSEQYMKEMNRLLRKKKAAMIAGNGDLVDSLEDQIEALRATVRKPADTPASGIISDEESARLDALNEENMQRFVKLSANQLSQLAIELGVRPMVFQRKGVDQAETLDRTHPDDLKAALDVVTKTKAKADTPATAEAKVEEQVQTIAATEGQRDAKEIKKEIAANIEQAIKDLQTGQSQAETITFQIPGDGTFKVLNQLISLQAVLKRVKRISTTDNSAPEKVKEPKQETTDYALEWGTEASFNTALDQLQEFVAANVEELQKNPNTIVPIERLTRYQGGRSRYTASQKASLAAAVKAWKSTQGSKMPTWAELRDWLGYRARQAGQSAGIEWTPEQPAAAEPAPESLSLEDFKVGDRVVWTRAKNEAYRGKEAVVTRLIKSRNAVEIELGGKKFDADPDKLDKAPESPEMAAEPESREEVAPEVEATAPEVTGEQQTNQDVWKTLEFAEAVAMKGAQVRDKRTGKSLGKLGNVRGGMSGAIAAVSKPKGTKLLSSLEILVPTTPSQSAASPNSFEEIGDGSVNSLGASIRPTNEVAEALPDIPNWRDLQTRLQTVRGDKDAARAMMDAYHRDNPEAQAALDARKAVSAQVGRPIPPAWTEVRIYPPGGRLLAKGRDDKSRLQSIYSSEDTAAALASKFERAKRVNDLMPRIIAGVSAGLNEGTEESSVLRLIYLTGFRNGGEGDTGAKVKAYGATTLLAEHVNIDGDVVTFDFIGKLGVQQQHTVIDAGLADDLRSRKASGGRLFKTSPEKVLSTLRSVAGTPDIKVHDLRTWNATSLAAELVKANVAPDTEIDYWLKRDAVGDIVARKLGDTRKIVLESYIDPIVFENWQESATLSNGNERPKISRKQADARGASSQLGKPLEDYERSLRDELLPPFGPGSRAEQRGELASLSSSKRPSRLGIDDDVVADALDELDALPESERERVNKIAGYDLITNEEQAAQAAAIKQEGTSQFYDETRDRENHKAWSKWANDAYNADPEGSIRKIVLEARNGFTGHSGQQAKLAMLVLEKLSRKAAFTGDAQMLRDVEAVTLAFDLRSTLAGREIAARWQPHATMEEQHRTTIAKAIFGPTGETRRKLDEAMSRASKNERIRELEAQVTKLLADLKARQAKPMKPAEKTTFVTDKKTLDKLRKDLERVKLAKTEAELLAEQNQTRLDEVREMFEESGFTMEEVMIGEAARLKLQSSPMVKKVLESFNPMERVAIRAIIEGKSDRAASVESKISRRENIRKVEARFDEALNNELDAWIDRGFTPDDMDRPDFASFMDKKGKLFASIRPQPGGITMAQRQKLRQSWRNAIHPPARVRNNTARKRLKSKKGKGTGLRIRNPQHAITVMRVLQREDTSGFDRVYEYWINGILSGIGTHTANVAGNTANAVLEYGLQRWVEAGVNMVVGSDKGATFGEALTMSKWVAGAAVTAFKQAKEAWNYEVSSFDWDAMGTHPKLDSLSVDGKTGFIHRLAIAGTKGRIIRIPSRALLFMDEFTKYFVGTIEAAAQGHRIAKAEKLTGAAFDDRVNELVRIPGSPAWVLALEKAQEMTFQQDLPKMLADAQKLLNAKSKSKLGATVRFALKMIFPFIKTPYNVLAAGLRKSPLGSVRLAGKAVTGGYKGKGAELSHDLAEQVIAAFVMMLVSGMAEGDPDDDKKPILITGTRGRDDRSEANFLNRSKGGETTVLFYGKPVFHYGRFAPLAVTVATIVNSLREMKKIPNGKDKIAVASSIFGDFVNTARSQTFLAGFDGLVNFVNSLSRESEGTEVQKAVKFLMNGAIPNIVRQTTRNLDEQVRDSKNAPWYYHAVPYGDLAEPLYDLYGRPAMKGGTALSRLFVTEPARVESVAPADVLLGRWNQLNPVQKEGDGSSYFPSDLTKASFKFKDSAGKYQDMTPAEIREFRRRVGVEISTQSAGLSTVPIQENIDELKKIRGSAAEKVKKEMFGGGVRPVLKSAPSLSQLLLGK